MKLGPRPIVRAAWSEPPRPSSSSSSPIPSLQAPASAVRRRFSKTYSCQLVLVSFSQHTSRLHGAVTQHSTAGTQMLQRGGGPIFSIASYSTVLSYLHLHLSIHCQPAARRIAQSAASHISPPTIPTQSTSNHAHPNYPSITIPLFQSRSGIPISS